MTNAYEFLTEWRVSGTAQEVYDLVAHPVDYPRWWPAVYLEVTEIAPPDATGVGRRVRLHTKGWLPYTLRWEAATVEASPPHRIAIRATGDFNGRGVWQIAQHGESVNVTFDWQLTADKPLLRRLSFLLKPLFSANHRWAMARGQESLELELARRRAATPEERRRVPAPPGPTTTSMPWLAAGVILAVVVVAALALW